MRVLVVGAGSVGVFFASKLSSSAHVSVVARSDYEALMRQHGVYHIRSCKGDYDFRPDAVYHDVSEVPEAPDILLCALKVLPGLDPAALCRPVMGKHTALFLIQNGLGNEKPFQEAFPENEIAGAIAYVGVRRPEPGTVEHLDGGTLAAGPFPVGKSFSKRMMDFIELFRSSGIPVSIESDITAKRWYKLLWNASYNPVSVLGVSADTSVIMSDPDAVALIEAVMSEVVEIAEADGCRVPREGITQNIEYTRSFAAYKPSTLQDFEAGRPLEIDALLGEPLRIADKYRIRAPHMRTLYALLKLAARKNSGE